MLHVTPGKSFSLAEPWFPLPCEGNTPSLLDVLISQHLENYKVCLQCSQLSVGAIRASVELQVPSPFPLLWFDPSARKHGLIWKLVFADVIKLR